MSCCLSYKDTILKANHSKCTYYSAETLAVAYPTKILFWKRITALQFNIFNKTKLLLILQRYYFESESQHTSARRASGPAVAYPTKILFWKRITANYDTHSFYTVLLLILQRYYFESESQLISKNAFCSEAVAYPTKILFWKRITAISRHMGILIKLLLILQRYYFESESQHILSCTIMPDCCCLSYKDTILKANHSRNV